MEAERTGPGSPADLGAAEVTGGSPESYAPGFTMQDVLSDIQDLVERRNIINVSINLLDTLYKRYSQYIY